ncbi:hypothetical protein JCM8097_006015 [Rhodosporidiobolus ruineniae]
MPYDAATGLYTSNWPDVALPDQPHSLFSFLFSSEPYSTASNAYRRSSCKDRLWLVDSTSGRSYTYRQALKRTLDLSRAFSSRGVGDGDAVVVFSLNDIDYGPCLWATARLGGVSSCANPAYTASELAHQIRTAHAAHPVKLILVHPNSIETAVKACEESGVSSEVILLMRSTPEQLSNVEPLADGFSSIDAVISSTADEPVPPEVLIKPEEARTKLALLSFSSGTTGLPKAVAIPHYAVIANILQGAQAWDKSGSFAPYNATQKTGDVVMAVLPFFHIYGLVVVLHTSLYQNQCVVVLPQFTFTTFLETIQRHRVSILFLVPPIVIMLVKQATDGYNLSSLRMTMTGAAPLTEETLTAFHDKFPKVTTGQGYGMTETCTLISLFEPNYPGGFPGGSAGSLVPNLTVKVVSPEGKLLPPNEIGELWSRSPSNALGYLNNDKATKETFDDEGFVHTGDEVRIDEKGHLYVVDRIKELIKSSGFQVAPAELEGHLLAHEDVQDVAVIGIPDEKRGEAPMAFIVLSPSTAARLSRSRDPSSAKSALVALLKKHVTDHKIKYKALAEVEFVEAIPKTQSGKLLRRDLRTLHAKKTKGEKAKM